MANVPQGCSSGRSRELDAARRQFVVSALYIIRQE